MFVVYKLWTSGDRPRKELLTFRGVQVILDRDLAELYGDEKGQLIDTALLIL